MTILRHILIALLDAISAQLKGVAEDVDNDAPLGDTDGTPFHGLDTQGVWAVLDED